MDENIGQTTKQPQVATELSVVNNNLDSLEKEIGIMSDRLQLVMLPPSEREKKEPEGDQGTCGLVRSLREITSRIMRSTTQLRDLLIRLEI